MGKIKRKGAYEYVMGWHQNHGALVVPKVAEQVLVYGKPIRKTVEEWPDPMDFMIRTKVPRSGFLQWGDIDPVMVEAGVDEKGNPRFRKVAPTEMLIQRISRYVVTRDGLPLMKWLPPLGGTDKNGIPRDSWRSFAVESGWTVQVCNNLDGCYFLRDQVNHDYYVQEVEKLVMNLK